MKPFILSLGAGLFYTFFTFFMFSVFGKGRGKNDATITLYISIFFGVTFFLILWGILG